jgi:hypothetical protein
MYFSWQSSYLKWKIATIFETSIFKNLKNPCLCLPAGRKSHLYKSLNNF